MREHEMYVCSEVRKEADDAWVSEGWRRRPRLCDAETRILEPSDLLLCLCVCVCVCVCVCIHTYIHTYIHTHTHTHTHTHIRIQRERR